MARSYFNTKLTQRIVSKNFNHIKNYIFCVKHLQCLLHPPREANPCLISCLLHPPREANLCLISCLLHPPREANLCLISSQSETVFFFKLDCFPKLVAPPVSVFTSNLERGGVIYAYSPFKREYSQFGRQWFECLIMDLFLH